MNQSVAVQKESTCLSLEAGLAKIIPKMLGEGMCLYIVCFTSYVHVIVFIWCFEMSSIFCCYQISTQGTINVSVQHPSVTACFSHF